MSVSPSFMDGSGGAYVALGCSKSGKTYLTKCLIRTYAKNFDTITILSGTDFSMDWADLGLSPEVISVARLERFLEVCSDEVRITGKKGRHLLICDDWIGKLKSTKASVISAICTAGRHSGITSIWLTQHMKALDLKIRTNVCDWIVMANQIPMVISGIQDVSPMNKASFMAQYSKLVKYDFVYINTSDNKVVFSRRLRNGFKLTPVLSARDRVTAQIKEEAAMRTRNEERVEMSELRVHRRSELQETYDDENDSSSSREPTREEAEEAEDRRNRRERARRGRDSSEVRTERESEESKPTPKKSDSGSLSGREKFEDKFARLRGFKIPPKQERITETEDRGRGGSGVRDGGDGGRKRTSRIQSSIL